MTTPDVQEDSTFGNSVELLYDFKTHYTEQPHSPVSIVTSKGNKKPQKPRRKRVRREKAELDQLRLESRKLETELAQLQRIYEGREEHGALGKKRDVGSSSTTRGYRLIAPRKKDTQFVWQEIAHRQLEARWRAQTTNRELREQLQAEYELGQQMLVLEHRDSNTKHVAALRTLSGRQHVPHSDTEAVFREQLSKAEDASLEMKKILLQPAFSDPTACFVNTFIEPCGKSKSFVMESNMTLPFTVQVTANSLWKVMTTDEMTKYCYDHCVIYRSDTVVAQAFRIHFITDVSDADFRVNYTLCRLNERDRVVIVWVAVYEPIELNELQYNGVQCHQLGWIEMSDDPSSKTNSTLARSFSRLSVDIGDGAEIKELQARALLTLAQPIHEKVSILLSAHLEKTLVEEDWKTRGWTASDRSFSSKRFVATV